MNISSKLKTKRLSINYISGAPSVSTRPEAGASGPRSHILGFIKGLKSLGCEVHPFIVGDKVPNKWVRPGVKSRFTKSKLKRVAADLVKILFGIYFKIKALQQLKNVKIIYERFGSFQSMGRPFQKRGAYWILETNGPFFAEASLERQSITLMRVARSMEVKAYQQCDLIVSVTEALKYLLVDELKINPEKILVIPNGVDVDFFNPEYVSQKRFFHFPVIGYVGSIIPRQGLDLLLNALAILNTEGIRFGFVAVGGGPSIEPLKEQAETLELAEQVRFIGPVSRDAVPGYIAGFDLGFSGQVVLGDGLLGQMYHSPLKIYEYLSMGKPVVASAFDDAKQVVKQNKMGFLFSPGNIDSLTAALRLAYIDRDKWPVMGKMAREGVITHHSWDNRAKKLIDHLALVSKG